MRKLVRLLTRHIALGEEALLAISALIFMGTEILPGEMPPATAALARPYSKWHRVGLQSIRHACQRNK